MDRISTQLDAYFIEPPIEDFKLKNENVFILFYDSDYNLEIIHPIYVVIGLIDLDSLYIFDHDRDDDELNFSNDSTDIEWPCGVMDNMPDLGSGVLGLNPDHT